MGGRNRGGQKRGRTQRRHFRDGRENVWKKSRADADVPSLDAGSGWDPFVTESPIFEQYYKKQGVVPENEWDSFLATLRKPLPAVFRINSSGQFAKEIKDQIQDDFMESLKKDNEIDGEVVELVKPLPWYPGRLAWHLNFSRMQLRKNQTLVRVHEFLKRENEIGSITRQEAVSMLPPLFLDVHSHHRVFDMCAAPGSKTFQLLEMMHSADKKGSFPDGLVVANDLDVQRCHLLIHQTKRMCSPNVIVTNHEAQHFPGLKKERNSTYNLIGVSESALESSSDPASMNSTEEEDKGLIFDRVLCDVPCSGDGTIRKAPDLWKKWNSGIANGLHRLQIQIAMRGVALLRVGGRLVYSTCSLNPVENEAVVGEILRRSKGCMELMDISNELPQLKRRPGMKTWKVRDRGLWIASYEQVNKHRADSIVPSMFPSGKGRENRLQPEDTSIEIDGLEQVGPERLPMNEVAGADIQIGKVEVRPKADEGEGEISVLPLERCLRILPHDQDTGGFFVAVFQKISPLKVEHISREPLRKTNNGPTVEASGDIYVCIKEQAADMLQNGSVEPVANLEEHLSGIKPHRELESEGMTCVSEDTSPDPIIVSDETNAGERQQNTVNAKVEAGDSGETDTISSQKSKGRVQQQGIWKGVDPVLFLKDETIIDSLNNFYGIKKTFPLHDHLVVRSEDASRLKRIYYVSKSVANVLKLNFWAGEQMKITSVGLKIFERQGGQEGFSQCAFRIASEGLPVLLPHLTKQIVHASMPDFKQLLSLRTVPFTAFEDENFATAVQALLPGCCVVILNDGSNPQVQNDTSFLRAIGCWRGRTNMSLLIPKAEAGQLLDRLSLSEGDEINSYGDLTKQDIIENMVDGGGMIDNYPEDVTMVLDEIDESESSTKLMQESYEPELSKETFLES